jgi:pimeloyl-ACP methyl ester carboxylesterase
LEFLEEAVILAGRGTVSLLPDQTFPWNGDPVGDATDLRAVVAQTIQARRGLDLLQDRHDVDSRRIAVVGHDYGGMYGLMLATVDRHRVRTAVAVNVDTTFCNWFLQFWLGFEGPAATAYQRLLEPVDPIRYVPFGPPGGTLFQMSVPDFFVPDSTARTLFAAASEPKDQRLYAGAAHELDDPQARADRIAWLVQHLSLPGS